MRGTAIAATALCGVALLATWGYAPANVTTTEVDRGVPAKDVIADESPSETAELAEIAPSTSESRVSAVPDADDESGPLDVDALVFGRVIDELGMSIGGATAYLVGSVPPETKGKRTDASVVAQVESDPNGMFRIASDDLTSDLEGGFDLGVFANGYERRLVPGAVMRQPDGGWLIVLERGLALVGRIVDEDGAPIPGLEVLACTRSAGVGHVSPSHRRRRARRAALANGASRYHQCLATSDAQGRVEFRGLAAGDVDLHSLDPGWSFVGQARGVAGGSYVEWTASRNIAVRLNVVDAQSGLPVEKVRGVFLIDLEFDDGSTESTGEWIGRGDGDVSLALTTAELPDFGDRRIVKATFFGQLGAGDAQTEWRAEPLEDPDGVAGVAMARVELDQSAGLLADGAEEGAPEPPAPPMADVELDVRYDDGTPFDGDIVVRWTSRPDEGRSRTGKERPKSSGLGRFRIEVPAGDVTLRVADRWSQGSIEAWEGAVRAEPDRAAVSFVTFERGATVRITRPDGFDGNWSTHASWRLVGEEEWFGSWYYGTDEDVLTLTALRPAEWRFRLRRDEKDDTDMVVRTVVVEVGDDALVDGP
ncbi:MAG: hypothetical protein AAF726_03605 [Planctomycetota bacterium]